MNWTIINGKEISATGFGELWWQKEDKGGSKKGVEEREEELGMSKNKEGAPLDPETGSPVEEQALGRAGQLEGLWSGEPRGKDSGKAHGVGVKAFF